MLVRFAEAVQASERPQLGSSHGVIDIDGPAMAPTPTCPGLLNCASAAADILVDRIVSCRFHRIVMGAIVGLRAYCANSAKAK